MAERILVIDDDPLLLKTVSNVLQRNGFEAITAESGIEGLERIKEKYFDIIVLDVRMPGIDGIETLKRIRELQRTSEESKAIIITGYTSEDVPIKAIKLEVDDYILKPFDLEVFLYSIRKNIKTARLEKEKKQHTQEIKELNDKFQEVSSELEETKLELTKYDRKPAQNKKSKKNGD